jgi:polyhydroxyalkanoate synthesis regulator phasin
MLEGIKKTIQASIGAVVLTRERVLKTLDRLVEEGKLSTEEAERLADRLIRDGKREFKGLEDKIVSLLQKGLRNLDIVSREDFENLKRRVETLEKKGERGRTVGTTRGKKR